MSCLQKYVSKEIKDINVNSIVQPVLQNKNGITKQVSVNLKIIS